MRRFTIVILREINEFYEKMFLLIFLNVFIFVNSESNNPSKMINWCLDTDFHKRQPGPASELYEQCTPWKNRSCCTYNTTYKLHNINHLKFNFDHCSNKSRMSDRCKRHFVQDFCFYECSPNIGPWVVKIDMKRRKERFFKVPLCESDCSAWFEACRDDFTCTDNWFRDFIWDKNGNHCLPEKECATFQQVFHNASNFCEMVWDQSWQVVNDSEPCMRLWFDGTDGNPNDLVALLKIHELMQMSSSDKLAVSTVASLLTVLLIAVS